MSGKKVQVGRSRMLEELARPTWEAASAGPKEKPEARRAETRQKVEKINAPAPVIQRKLRVAAYARVSTDLDSQETSIENQCDHYKSLIEANPAWELAGIYAESGVSGTKADTRPELQRLMQDCEAGAVDVIVTKSISRFARNTSECLSMVRELTSLGIRLIFEKENIDTETMESEFLLTLLAAFAESESQSISSNQKWSIRRRFQAGTYKGGKVPYGYRRTKKGYIIHPAEAATVRRIFYALADGKGTLVIARKLNEERIPTWTESYKGLEAQGKWRSNSIIAIAKNEFYTGDRKAFARLMEAAENGEIDRIETKSAFDFIGSIDELVSTASRLNSLDNPVRVHFDVEGVTTGTAEWERCVGFLMSFLHSEKRRDAADAERRERVMCGI